MKFVFFPQGCLPFHARSLDERPLGGIETGVIRLSEALAQAGHEVIVLTAQDNPPLSSPLYLPLRAVADLGAVDVLIAVREWTPLLVPIKSRIKLYWTGDSYDQFQNIGMGDGRLIEQIDGFLAVSNWHAERMCQESGFPREKTVVIRNGIKLSLFSGGEPKLRKRLIYSSTPYRGLRFLPLIFSELKKQHPEAELHAFSGYEVYAGAAPPPPEALKEYEAIRRSFSGIADCHLHGSIRQSELAREFMRSSILLYPNTFEETSCITAMEAQAAGCAIVTSQLGALPETVGDAGLLIPGRPGSNEYLVSFIQAASRLLADDPLFAALSANGRRRAQQFDWSAAAARLLKYLSEHPKLARP